MFLLTAGFLEAQLGSVTSNLLLWATGMNWQQSDLNSDQEGLTLQILNCFSKHLKFGLKGCNVITVPWVFSLHLVKVFVFTRRWVSVAVQILEFVYCLVNMARSCLLEQCFAQIHNTAQGLQSSLEPRPLNLEVQCTYNISSTGPCKQAPVKCLTVTCMAMSME